MKKPLFEKKYWSIPRVWEGCTVFVIGGGPSFEAQKKYIPRIRKWRCIGVNTAYELGSCIDVVFFGDEKWWGWHAKTITPLPFLIVTNCESPSINSHRVRRVHRLFTGWSTKQNELAWNGNSGYASVNLAGLLGAKRVIMLGFDMMPTGNRFHWHKEHPSPSNAGNFSRYLNNTGLLVHGAKRAGVELVNCSPISKIKEIPFTPLETVLKELESQ